MCSLDVGVESNGYAVYMFNVNRHHVSAENQNVSTSNSKSSDSDESSICLSLLSTNLEAEQETQVRCHVQKTLSSSDSVGFENEGRCLQVKSNGEMKEPFVCYYHHLVRDPFNSECNSPVDETYSSFKKMSFFVCLMGHDDEVMNSFCSELSIFCNQLLPYLEPQEHEHLQTKLKLWCFFCVKYIMRCIENFKESLVILFQSALHPKVVVECENENMKWDLERFIDACSLTNLFQSSPVHLTKNDSESPSACNDSSASIIHLKVSNGKLTCEQELSHSTYCQKWVDELLACDANEYVRARNVLEMFRLKTVRDVNTMMRLLKKAENDYYSLFKAYQFYNVSGYGDILLRHVKEEAILTCCQEALDMIESLCEFIAKNTEET